MAQQSTLRVWTDRQTSKRVALPDLSHLLKHELDGPRLLHGFQYEQLTSGAKAPTVADLDRIPGRLGAVLVELPLRDGGYVLPTWDELAALSAGCRERDVPLHFDGARIWEAQPYLGHTLAEIADLADTVYVSLYKGLAGLSGALLAGPQDVVDEARQWRTRHGGTLVTMMPNAVVGVAGAPRAAAPDARLLRARGRGRGSVFCRWRPGVPGPAALQRLSRLPSEAGSRADGADRLDDGVGAPGDHVGLVGGRRAAAGRGPSSSSARPRWHGQSTRSPTRSPASSSTEPARRLSPHLRDRRPSVGGPGAMTVGRAVARCRRLGQDVAVGRSDG